MAVRSLAWAIPVQRVKAIEALLRKHGHGVRGRYKNKIGSIKPRCQYELGLALCFSVRPLEVV